MPEHVTVIESGPPGSYERFVDTLAHYLANPPVLVNQPDTTVVNWITYAEVGAVELDKLPLGLIASLDDKIIPFGKGGSTGGRFGSDLDQFEVPLLIVQAEHEVEPSVPTTAPAPASGYWQAPGGRELIDLCQTIRKALRAEITFGGSVATSTISELRPMLIDLDNKVYRGARLTIVARQRRTRG
jgi:hypothetical protein